jgi:hypothetical protein
VSFAKWVGAYRPTCICARGGIASCAVGLGFVCVVFGRTDCYYSCLYKSLHLNFFLLDALSGHHFLLKTQGSSEREWISGQLQQQHRQCAAHYQIRATWKLESSKTLFPHGSRASTTTYAIFFGSLSLGLFTSLRQLHQRMGRPLFAFYQVQSQIQSLDVGYDQKALQRLPTERCQACCFPHGAVSLVAHLQSMLPHPDIQT